jgi:hypothetical protein
MFLLVEKIYLNLINIAFDNEIRVIDNESIISSEFVREKNLNLYK